MGDDLDQDEITRLLGVEPTSSAREGAMRRTGAGRGISTETGIWSFGADDATPGDLDNCVAVLLASLPSDPVVWRDLSRRFRCDVFCGVFVDGGNAGASLRPEILAMLGERKRYAVSPAIL